MKFNSGLMYWIIESFGDYYFFTRNRVVCGWFFLGLEFVGLFVVKEESFSLGKL